MSNSIETNTETNSKNNKEIVSEEAIEMNASSGYEELSDVQSISDNKYTCSYENVKHDFIVYLPEATDNAPFIIMLHGYGESGEGFCNKVHLEAEACERGFDIWCTTPHLIISLNFPKFLS